MRIAVLAVCAALAGCGTAQVVSTTPRTVVVQSMEIDPAMKTAQAECQKNGRNAQLTAADGVQYPRLFRFDCVL